MKNAPCPSRKIVSGKGREALLTTASATARCGAYGNRGFREWRKANEMERKWRKTSGRNQFCRRYSGSGCHGTPDRESHTSPAAAWMVRCGSSRSFSGRERNAGPRSQEPLAPHMWELNKSSVATGRNLCYHSEHGTHFPLIPVEPERPLRRLDGGTTWRFPKSQSRTSSAP